MSPTKKIGQQTFRFANPPVIIGTGTIVGDMEGKGPYGNEFDWVIEDSLFGQKSWEKAEQRLLLEAIKLALKQANLQPGDIDFLLAGDLLNQLISSNYTARDLGIPFLGLYGACSTMAESLALGAMLIDGGFAYRVAVAVSSHHDSAERQYRFPTELGVQRLPSSQWTTTGSGAAIVCQEGAGPRITEVTVGKVIDRGSTDINDMGSAMAPAAAATLEQHLQDTGRQPEEYDLILTGDLGRIGKACLENLLKQQGREAVVPKLADCGVLIYSPDQDTHAGGSGCGCSAVMFCGPMLQRLKRGEYRRLLLIATGALMSPTTAQQGEVIPGIAHAVLVEQQS